MHAARAVQLHWSSGSLEPQFQDRAVRSYRRRSSMPSASSSSEVGSGVAVST